MITHGDPYGVPGGPWVLVVGMHRSGTSAVTGALGALGLNLPRQDDRIDQPESNPEHWESLSISRHDEALLERLGASWDAPPDLDSGWESTAEVTNAADPAAIASAAYPQAGPLVWKDPRLCLLLPYWRTRLPGPLTAVFVWRSPMAVARSLQNRDGFELAEGIALWERYNRSAIGGLTDLDFYGVDYELMMDDPRVTIRDLAEWLGSLDQFAAHRANWNVASAVAEVAHELRHERGDIRDPLLLDEHRRLVELLSTMRGGHRPMQPDAMPAESHWTTALIRSRPRGKGPCQPVARARGRALGEAGGTGDIPRRTGDSPRRDGGASKPARDGRARAGGRETLHRKPALIRELARDQASALFGSTPPRA